MQPIKTSIIATFDVEDFFLPRPPADMIFAELDEELGIRRMMSMLEDHAARGTFFVDVYNRTTLTEALIRQACDEIHTRGHEVALHTHPEFPSGKRGYGMEQVLSRHDLAWQTEFVMQGKAWLTSWIGEAPVSHRAGGYGANYDTLRALAAAGIPIDSSLFYGYPHCGLNDPPLGVNAPVRWGGVLEIPIAVTDNAVELNLGFRSLELVRMRKKVDPDWCDLNELKCQIRELVKRRVDPIVLFLHSYSFVEPGSWRPARVVMERFRALLEWIADEPELQLRPMRDFRDLKAEVGDNVARETVPAVRLKPWDFSLETMRWAAGRIGMKHLKLLWQGRGGR